MSFGYLPQSDMETEALRTEEEMQKAIRKLQQFAQIPLTGELDTKTMEMMTVSCISLLTAAPTQNHKFKLDYVLVRQIAHKWP